MATPFFSLIEELRSLGGTPKVTFPYGDPAYPQTERVIKAKRGNHILDWGTPEPDGSRFPHSKLTDEIELTSDAQFVEVYRKYEVLPGPFTKQGQDYDPQFGFLAPYTEGEVLNGAGIGAPLTDVAPENYVKAQKRTYAIPTAALDAFSLTFPGTTSIDLPRVLESISVVWDVTTAAGSYSESGSGAAIGTSAALAISANGRGQGSASVTPELIPIFNSIWTDDLPVTDYFFFLPNPVTLSAVLAKVSTLAGAAMHAWPVFKPKSHTFVLIGQKISLSAEATARCAVSLNASDLSETQSQGHGTNYDYGSTVRSATIPECIHAAITLTGGTTNTSAATAVADATVTAGTNFPGAHDSSSAGASAAGRVAPTSLSATSPPALPASGLYLKSSDVALFKWGYSTVRCRVFDFGVLS